MYYCQLSVLIILIISIGIIDSSILLRDDQSNDIHIKSPNLSRKSNSSIDSLKFVDENIINPCNGLYIKTNGTTCNLKEIMIGRCYEYQYIKRGLYLSNRTEIKNCTKLYELFESSVRYKSYCNMNMNTYQSYFQYALEDIHVIDRGIFWSGTYSIAHAYSNRGWNYITLEDTLAANMADGLMWCGKENDNEGFDYFSCPNSCKDNIWADVAFWGLASKTFAEKVTGEIYVVMNGSRSGDQQSFRNNSYFARFEIPNFKREGKYRVTKINILLLHTPDVNVVEKCGDGSLIVLENLIRKSGFEYKCIDDPEELLLIMCGDQWEASECQVAKYALRKQWNNKLLGKSIAIQYSFTFHLFLFSLFIHLSNLIISIE